MDEPAAKVRTEIIPYIFYRDVPAALDWLASAFGLRETMRVGTPSRRAAQLSPAATDKPWPSDPVAASKNGKPSTGLGWPSIADPISRSIIRSRSIIALRWPSGSNATPRSVHAA